MPRRAASRCGGSSYCHDWQYTICNDSTAPSTSPVACASEAASRTTRSHRSSGSGDGPFAGRCTCCATPTMHGARGSMLIPGIVGALWAPWRTQRTNIRSRRRRRRRMSWVGAGSLVLPLGRALLGERLGPLLGVLAGEDHLGQLLFDLVRLLHRDREAAQHALLR